MLSRMKTGKTRSSDLGKDVQAGMDYVNGSVGVIMFFEHKICSATDNIRSQLC